MIFDSIDSIERYKSSPDIYSALSLIKETDLKELRTFTTPHRINSKVTVRYIKSTTKNFDECIFESHRKFIDIHFTLSGVEGIGVRDVNSLTEIDSFNFDKDIGFYSGDYHSINYLHPGEFLICFPDEAHKVSIRYEDIKDLEKMIVKIKI